MVLSKSQMWDKYHKEAMKEEDPDNYINARGLEIIRVAEGHNKGYDAGSKTTYYGITQAGIDGLEALQRVYKVKLPEWIRDAKVDKITEKQAKDLTKWNAMLNTKLIEDFSSSPNFTKLSLDTRSAFLTYFHNVSPYSMRKSFDENKPGSFLRAVRTGNPYLMGQSLISRADGSSLGDINDGYKRRAMMAVMAVGNKDFTMSIQQERDMDIRFKLPKFGDEAHQRLGELANNWFSYRKNSELMFAFPDKKEQPKEQKPVIKTQKPIEQAPQVSIGKKGTMDMMIANLTNAMKNLFTNYKEDTQNAPRNTDVNM